MDLEEIAEIDLEEILEIEEVIIIRAPKRYIRDTQNPFEVYCDDEFRRRFRFSKDFTRL